MTSSGIKEKSGINSFEEYYNEKKEYSIPTIFQQVVSQYPERIAVEFADNSLSYNALNSKANQLSHYILNEYHIKPGSVIGIYADSSEWVIISILAILKIGCIYLPLDSKYPEERIKYMIDDADISFLLIESFFLESIHIFNCPYVLIEDLQDKIQHSSTENPDNSSDSSSPTYIMYTSGTTGTPNGVLVPQLGIIRLVFSDYIPFDEPLTFLQLAPLGFDASTFEIWGPLLHGNKLVIYRNHIPEFSRIQEVIRHNHVNCLWLTAALFNAIIDEEPAILQGIQYLLTGGEALSVSHIRKAQKMLPKTIFINGYGPTECTTFTTCYRIPRIDGLNLKSIPIGKPITATSIFVLDKELVQVKQGEVGELYIGGDGLAIGYINNEELTKKRFIFHNSLVDNGIRLYKTGDLCRELPDNTIEFIGRTDFQVKINGFRIEIDEIEVCLKKYIYIADAVVLIKQKGDLKKIVAYVVPRINNEKLFAKSKSFEVVNLLERNALAKYLLSWLPNYMIPNEIIELTNFPININGKLDRNALLDIELRESPNEEKDHFEGQEDEIRLLCERMLSIRIAQREENFFELGAESLSLAQLIFHINRTYFVEVPINHFYNEPTFANLMRIINNEHTEEFIHISNCIRKSNQTIEKLDNQQIIKLKNEYSLIKVKDGTGTPLFIAPGMLGNAFLFVEFSRNLRVDNPVYVFEYPVRQDGSFVTHTMEELATYFVTNIQQIQPKGQYHLAGFSFGGRLIFEIARQLENQNNKIETITIIDAEGFHRKNRFNYSKLGLELYVFLKLPLRLKLIYLYKRQALKGFGKIKVIFESKKNNNENQGLSQHQQEHDYLKLWYNFYTDYKLNCDMTLIKGMQKEWDSLLYYIKLIRPDMYFKASVKGKFTMIDIDCQHMGFFKSPHTVEFAQKMQQIITKQV